ncbi:unnamed protein product [Periconia digitata]|uniref:Uncharacterized protein n=1 Tax=Periconia digitata TaxID=1303443 RepID=A0A9W4UU43_9PLEO|nr:unnamed protein product [Periconia digitata]
MKSRLIAAAKITTSHPTNPLINQNINPLRLCRFHSSLSRCNRLRKPRIIRKLLHGNPTRLSPPVENNFLSIAVKHSLIVATAFLLTSSCKASVVTNRPGRNNPPKACPWTFPLRKLNHSYARTISRLVRPRRCFSGTS